MTKEFEEWFDKSHPASMFGPAQDEREILKVHCWLAWRDALRSASNDN